LDVAVNSAGTEGKPGPFTDQTAESYAATFDTNVFGTLLCMKHELRVMLPQGSGSIVNVSSTYGRAGAPGAALYVASKHAVEGLTKASALECAESWVRINVVAPGTTETGMLNRFTGTPENKAALMSSVPMKRIAQPEEIAEAILFVGSNKASYITGASLAVDGRKLACDEPNNQNEIVLSACLIFVRDQTLNEQELAAYLKEVPPTLAGDKAKILASYGSHEDLEGPSTEGTVILEFPSTAAARDWYNRSPYQGAHQHRLKGARYRVTLTNRRSGRSSNQRDPALGRICWCSLMCHRPTYLLTQHPDEELICM
jgi:uncharacterized protein (DUF1330 family)/short-subunit dehydrogenase involved in D-alanine esterification of teichoic acids